MFTTTGKQKFWGLLKKIWKILHSKFFFKKTKSKILKNSIFAFFFYQIVLFNTKYQFEMILAFIWCIYYPYWWKILDFQKLSSLKLKSLLCQMRLLRRPIVKNIWITVWFLKFYRRINIPNVIWDHFCRIWMKIVAVGPR